MSPPLWPCSCGRAVQPESAARPLASPGRPAASLLQLRPDARLLLLLLGAGRRGEPRPGAPAARIRCAHRSSSARRRASSLRARSSVTSSAAMRLRMPVVVAATSSSTAARETLDRRGGGCSEHGLAKATQAARPNVQHRPGKNDSFGLQHKNQARGQEQAHAIKGTRKEKEIQIDL